MTTINAGDEPVIEVGQEVESACPTCGAVHTRTAYDVGSGPELSCSNCEWCWGANGQDLKPLTLGDVARGAGPFPGSEKS